jgi:hypothetical protein
MRRLIILGGSLLLLAACNAPGTAGTPGAGASASPGSAGGQVSGDIYASKQSYLAFLDCAGKKDATAASMAGPLKAAVNVYTDAQWAQAKVVVQATHKAFIDRYGAGCM